MKKNILTLVLFLVAITSNQAQEIKSVINKDALVKFEENPPAAVGVNQVSDVNYSFTLLDANKNAASYNLKMYADLTGVRTDTVDVATVTSFPTTLSLSAADLADLLGITVDDIGFGDNFYFSGSVTTTDGQVYSGDVLPNYDDLDDDDPQTFEIVGGGVTADLLDETGYRQAFEFGFVILCPSVDLSELVGTYTITYEAFSENSWSPVTVIAGPEANQLTIKNMYELETGDIGYDLILDVDMSTGAITIETQEVFDTAFYSFPYGICSVTSAPGTNYVFSCTGGIALFVEYTVAAGSFGTGSITMTKI